MTTGFRQVIAMLVLLAGLAVFAVQAKAERDAITVHVFGNSLVHHLTDSPQTAVHWWLAELARAGGKGFALSGQWGFLRDFARDGVADRWVLDGVARAPDPVDAIILTPTNFIQHQAPDQPYHGDNPEGATPLGATLATIKAARDRWPDAPILIYEGWPDMGGFTHRFPPSLRNLRRWHGYALSDYHDWYRDFIAILQNARPEAEITLLPISSVLSGLQTGLLEDVPVEALFSDDSPHGTATQYFLAALVTYTALYQTPAPPDFALPETLHPLVRARYRQITDEIAQALGLHDEARAPASQKRQAGLGLENPSLGMGLNGLSDWSTQHPFIDIMKTARPWIGHTASEWGAFPTEALRAGGYLDAHGWPLALPDGARALESLILTDQPAEAAHLRGRYILRYEGEGVLRVTGRADNVRYDYAAREIRFDSGPGEGSVVLQLTRTDRDNPLRDITIVREEHETLHAAGAVFNPLWLARIADLRLVRFMDWQFTNGSDQTVWEDRPVPEDASYVWRGAPVEIMVRLANRIGADPWVNMPHAADDAYMRAFAEYMRDHLAPGLKVHLEYSNEVWNLVFPQAVWAREAAMALWGDGAGDDAWMQFAGLRAAQMAAIWRKVFADAPERLVVVAGTHTGWPGLEEPMLMAPLAVRGGQIDAAPVDQFDAYAVTGYFGHELGEESMIPTIEGWIAASRAVAHARATEAGAGADEAAYLAAHGDDLAFDLAAEALRQGSLGELLRDALPYHAQVAARHGLELVMYEGGTHVVGHGSTIANDEITRFFTAFSYSPQMGTLYEELLSGWHASGGTLFNAFVDVTRPSKWGSWGALRHLDDATPRWQVLMQANAQVPSWDDPRPPGTFLHGAYLRAGNSGERIEGTAKSDIMIGGAGDDVFLSHGGDDLIHGGAGRDLVILPGKRAEYGLGREGARVILQGLAGTLTLTDVEAVEFADTPGAPVALSDLM
ncbi:calcium-binding protein [Roseovarius autotrophicus]|uniref:calcium-binding protein n=1 Tax=Roseovarius autotrophicus TaxID=2824121 RepID=UPI001FFD2651|nr:calcium-binding protein [Roseovarius autotrophicus]